MMPKTSLSKTAYQRLLNDIAAIHDKAMKDLAGAVDAILKIAYWNIGRVIVEVEQKGGAHAGYGDHLLEQISDDMTKSNRKGFSVRNIRNMRSVYLAFSIRQLTAELTWTHFVALASIQDEKQRREYTEKAIKNSWNVEDLQTVLLENNVVTSKEEQSTRALSSSSKETEVIRLSVKRGVLNTYKIVDPIDGEEDPQAFWVDCGFFIYHKIKESELFKSSERSFKPGEFVSVLRESDKYAFKRFESKDVPPKSVVYTFKAHVVKVTDADTITVLAELGFGFLSKQKLRLRRINAAEIKTPAGVKARDFVVKSLKLSGCIVIKTYSTDIFDRYLVDVFYLPGSDDAETIAREGILLNQELIDEGLAEVWQTQDPDELAFLN